jgi:hypothetical protein
MAFPKFDESKHHRDLLGRFAGSSGGPAVQRFRRGGLSRVRLERQYGHEERAIGQRGETAFKPPRPAGLARQRHAKITGKAHDVKAAYAATARGTATWPQRNMVEYASPAARDKARAQGRSLVRPQAETMRVETSLARGGRTPRKNTKRAFAGRVVVERGYGREYTDRRGYLRTSSHVRNLAGMKGRPAAPTAGRKKPN